MAYCALDDVKAKCPRLPMTATSTPTQAQVEGYIDGCTAEIDGILVALGYVVPATGMESLKLLKKICSDGAAFYSLGAAFSNVGPNRSDQGEAYRIAYKDALSALRKGESILSDAPLATHFQTEPRSSGFASNFESDSGLDNLSERDRKW